VLTGLKVCTIEERGIGENSKCKEFRLNRTQEKQHAKRMKRRLG
jgi:hypothetical protein